MSLHSYSGLTQWTKIWKVMIETALHLKSNITPYFLMYMSFKLNQRHVKFDINYHYILSYKPLEK